MEVLYAFSTLNLKQNGKMAYAVRYAFSTSQHEAMVVLYALCTIIYEASGYSLRLCITA